jgi:hypothetical protein
MQAPGTISTSGSSGPVSPTVAPYSPSTDYTCDESFCPLPHRADGALAALCALDNELADPDFLAREDAPSPSIRLTWALDDRYHQANANVATITGITTTSMIAVELIFRSKRLKCAR